MSAWVKNFWAQEIVRYIVVGVINTILGFTYYSILLLFLTYGYALTIGYIFGISSSYLLNTSLVFKHKPTWTKFFQFPIVYVLQYIVSLFVIFISVEYFGIDERIAYLFSIMLTIPLTFLMSRFIITRPATKAIDEEKEHTIL